MKRIKSLEYSWIFKASFYVGAYTVEFKGGKTFVIYAHDLNDVEFFLTRLECEHGQHRRKSYIRNKKGHPRKKPFWYRGRVYELGEGR